MPAIASELLGLLRARRPPAPSLTRGPRRWRPRWTVRLRLTLLYGGLFLLAGTLLLAITYGLVSHSVSGSKTGFVLSRTAPGGKVGPKAGTPSKQLPDGFFYTGAPGSLPQPPPDVLREVGSDPKGTVRQVQIYSGQLRAAAQAEVGKLSNQAETAIAQERTATLNQLLTKSAFALAIMTLVSIGLGWLMAGRALRPVRTMNARARGISEHNLHERLALEGPNDELTELANTFDGMLERLEGAFESQRLFVANASHELRTPITVERTLVEVALADPDATVESLRATCERVLAAGEQQERLIEALLTLARSQRGLDHRAKLDLGDVAGEVVQGRSLPDGSRAARSGKAGRRAGGWREGVVLESILDAAPVMGDPALVERLIANLVDNAVAYNTDGGWARTWTGVRDGTPTLLVANSGPIVPADQVEALIEPFRRLDGDRTGHPAGLGLGLSIVGAIAAAHGAELGVRARDEGGLEVEVRFLGV